MNAVPLLNYIYTTAPNPLQVSANGTITVIASNPPPGIYAPADAPFPNNGYVGVRTLVFDFGHVGYDDSELTSLAATTWTVTPPPHWNPPSIAGLKLTFTAPGNGIVSPADGLSFVFSEIPINAAVGAVTLTITETAYTPGDSRDPFVYPALPPQELPPPPRSPIYQTASLNFQLGKFPAHFAVGDFSAQPPNVSVGGSPTLSWNGTPGATYALSYGSTTITHHQDGSLLGPTDRYPNTTLTPADPSFALQDTTVFTLTVTYTPPGDRQPISFQRQVTVGVSLPDITATNVTVNGVVTLTPGPTRTAGSWSIATDPATRQLTFASNAPNPQLAVQGALAANFFGAKQQLALISSATTLQWASSSNTAYLGYYGSGAAATDGFLIACVQFTDAGGADFAALLGYTSATDMNDHNAGDTPQYHADKLVAAQGFPKRDGDVRSDFYTTLTLPVQKGEFWRVLLVPALDPTNTGAAVIVNYFKLIWQPLGF